MTRTAAALIIGNELLTGKVQDENFPHLARELFSLGIELRRVVICPDELEVIVRDLDALRATHDFVFTSGGIGPTHDDITIEAVARAFGRPVERSGEVERMLRDHYGPRMTEDHLRIANIPEGARLVRNADVPWPTLAIDNVFVLPGVPEIFKKKFSALRRALGGGAPFVTHEIYTLCDEGEVAELLRQLVADYPTVSIGSYPRWRDVECTVKLTFDGQNPDAVREAADALVRALPADKIVRRRDT